MELQTLEEIRGFSSFFSRKILFAFFTITQENITHMVSLVGRFYLMMVSTHSVYSHIVLTFEKTHCCYSTAVCSTWNNSSKRKQIKGIYPI